MDFLLTDEQRTFRNALRSWLPGHLPEGWKDGRFVPNLPEQEQAARLRQWEQSLHAARYSVVHWPSRYGGRDLSIVEHFIAGDECGRVAAPEGINAIGRELVGAVLLHAGTEAQKQAMLPRIATCEDVWCQGFSEPNAGSDLASLTTCATARGDGWRISGQKIWTSYAQHSDMCLLLARTSRELRKHAGLSLFAMPMSARGVDRRPIAQLDGRQDLNELFLTDVELGPEAVIGPVGEGWRVANAVLDVERATTRLYRQARYVNELQHAIRLASARQPAETAVPEDLRHRAAAVFAELNVLKALNVDVVSRIARGEHIGPASSVLKQCWSHFHQHATDVAAQLLGDDHWFAREEDSEARRFLPLYLHTRAETILAGTAQIQRNIIADRLLALPRES